MVRFYEGNHPALHPCRYGHALLCSEIFSKIINSLFPQLLLFFGNHTVFQMKTCSPYEKRGAGMPGDPQLAPKSTRFDRKMLGLLHGYPAKMGSFVLPK